MPYEEHPVFTDPTEKDVKLWRYMDFTKLVSLLQKEALFFPSARTLQKIDPWEGQYTKKDLKEIIYKDVQRMNKSSDLRITFDIIKNHSESLLNSFKYKEENIYISCWHFNTSESSAMWKLYIKDTEGVAIQTDIKLFMNSFRNVKQDVHIGKVIYKNYELDEFYENLNHDDKIKYRENLYTTFIHKRKNYDFEREYRAIIDIGLREGKKDATGLKIETEGKGIFVPVDLKLLIKKIIIAPGSQEWFEKLVKETLKTYKIDVGVVRSVVDDEPYRFDLEPYKDLKE